MNNRMENETTFIRIYPLLSDVELADYYRVEVDSIQKRAKELGLKKDPSLTKYDFKEEEEEEEANKKMMNQPPTNKSGAQKKLNTDWGIAQRNTLDKLNNKRKELESKILKSEKFDERTYEEWKVINLKCQGLEYILK